MKLKPFIIGDTRMKILLASLVMFALGSAAFGAGREVEYEVRNETYLGYYISPGENAPLILLVHDWDGLTDYEVKRAGMLVELGYAVFAADLFGKGVRPTEVKDKRQHTGELYQDREKMRALLTGALEAAEAEGASSDRLVVMGYCFGGAAVLEGARAGMDARAFVTFHGGLGTPEGQEYSETEGQVVVFHGSADPAITLEDFASLAEELEKADVAHEMTTYGGAPHAFTVFGSDRYDAEADERSWARFTRLLEQWFAQK